MKIGSLFSGYGGLDLGLSQVIDAEPVWFSEIEKAPSQILAHHWPDVPNLGDITKIDWADVEPVDILTGGYPCQPFSQAGSRRGSSDHRHLWPYVADAVAALRPAWTVFENVQGHLSLGFDEVLRDLFILGYEARWKLLRASDIGAPHQRARLFIVGRKNERSIRGRVDRWGRVHRDRPCEGCEHVCDSRSSCDGHERLTDSRINEIPVRRADTSSETRDRPACAEACLDSGRCLCIRIPCSDSAPSDSEIRSGNVLHRPVGSDTGQSQEIGSVPLERQPSETRETSHVAGPGREPARAGLGQPTSRGARRDRDIPVGRVVGAERQPHGAGPIHGKTPEVGADDRRRNLRVALRGDADELKLPTPRATRGGSATETVALLPTPVSDNSRGLPSANTSYQSLPNAVTALLPTPAVNDMGRAYTPEEWDEWTARMKQAHNNGNGHGKSLEIETARTYQEQILSPETAMGYVNFGDYGPAVAQWEQVINRPAPPPTEPTGRNNAHRLSPRFVEWMMGLPAGHVTDVPGLSRVAQLKALGNGVVPQQAAAAITDLLTIQQEVAA